VIEAIVIALLLLIVGCSDDEKDTTAQPVVSDASMIAGACRVGPTTRACDDGFDCLELTDRNPVVEHHNYVCAKSGSAQDFPKFLVCPPNMGLRVVAYAGDSVSCDASVTPGAVYISGM
jgi:hypothetical protein